MSSNFGEGFLRVLEHQENKGVQAVLDVFKELRIISIEPNAQVMFVETHNQVEGPDKKITRITMTEAYSLELISRMIERKLQGG